ncbi:hypothetical protein [Plantibacter sp. T3]|uniref:hypothetical protein n=1 Tax=Plantibacter sp. T3 TaxID=2653161 RepID=UPI00135803A2|nr:hypothetical protein [Plantibacter sp. T3]
MIGLADRHPPNRTSLVQDVEAGVERYGIDLGGLDAEDVGDLMARLTAASAVSPNSMPPPIARWNASFFAVSKLCTSVAWLLTRANYFGNAERAVHSNANLVVPELFARSEGVPW